MNKTIKVTYCLDEVSKIATNIIELLSSTNLLAMKGDLGAGKTTLTKEIISQLGITGEVTSPTYSLVNEYDLGVNRKLYHMDLYRLEDVDEAIEIGIEDMLWSGHLCIIEWPEIIFPLIDQPYIELTIKHLDASSREISIEYKEF